MDLKKFEELEKRVSAMLDRLASLTRYNEKLQADLTEAKDELKNTQADLEAAQHLIGEMQAEREAALARLDSIIGRLE